MWFIGVEVEQETSAPPPKKNPGSAPVMEGLVPKKRRRNSAKMSHALRYELREPVAKTEPNNKSLK